MKYIRLLIASRANFMKAKAELDAFTETGIDQTELLQMAAELGKLGMQRGDLAGITAMYLTGRGGMVTVDDVRDIRSIIMRHGNQN